MTSRGLRGRVRERPRRHDGYEAYVSTQQPTPEPQAWLQGAHVEPGWPAGAEASEAQGPRQAGSVMARRGSGQDRLGHLNRGVEIRDVLRRGRHYSGAAGALKVSEGKADVPRLCVVVSRRVGGAVVRNRIRRRIREIARREIDLHASPVDLVFRASPGSGSMEFEGIYEAFTGQLRRAGLLQRPRREQWTGQR